MILVTGANGFVGRNFVSKLNKDGVDHIQLDKSFDCKLFGESRLENLEKEKQKVIQYELGSFRDFPQEYVQDVTCIVHLASESHVDTSISSPRKFIDANISGTMEIFEIAKKLPNLKQVILFSTDEVVACLPERRQAFETSLLHCGNVYSATKGAQELLAQAYIKTWNLPIITTRCVNIFGSYQAFEKFIPKTISHVLKDLPVVVYGEGYQERQWVHVDFVCRFLSSLLEANYIPPGQVLHITGTKELTNINLVYLIAGLLGKTPMINHVEDRKGHDERYSLYKSTTVDFVQDDYEDEKTFLSDLKKTVEFYRGELK